LKVFETPLEQVLPKDRRPIVAYLAAWTLAKESSGPKEELGQAILNQLLEVIGKDCTLVMPIYTNGFKDGFINLDSEPCITGIVNELFRRMPETRRTASAWFSFAVQGPEAEALTELRP
jgi:aminoglycoside N3'-acetyltransferase